MNGLTLVDTDILIDAARHVGVAADFLDTVESTSALAASVITQMELFVGCRDRSEQRNTERFLQRFRILKLNELIGDAALELLRRYRLSHGLLIPDALIAATALALGQCFVTKNQRDYQFIEGLRLLPYPSSVRKGIDLS